MSSEPRDYLRHILAKAEYLVERTAGLSLDVFRSVETLRRAFVRSLEIIGEASKRIPDDFRSRHSDIDWRGMAALRDRLIHGYFGVDYDIVWDVVTTRIPELRVRIATILGD